MPRRSSSIRRLRARQFDDSVPSPCVQICRYDGGDLCVGCLRSPDEIRDWMIMTRAEKLAVLERIEQRRSDGCAAEG